MSTLALTVSTIRESNGRQALSNVSRPIGRKSGIGREIAEALGLTEDLAFIDASEDIVAVEVDRQKILAASFDSLAGMVNSSLIDTDQDLTEEFDTLITTQRELQADQAAKVFLEIV